MRQLRTPGSMRHVEPSPLATAEPVIPRLWAAARMTGIFVFTFEGSELICLLSSNETADSITQRWFVVDRAESC